MGDTATVQALEHTNDLRAIEPAWTRLLERAVSPRPTQTPVWLSSWWRVFGGSGGRQLRLIAVSAGGELVGIVPLLRRWVRRDGLFPVATLELLGSGEERGD